MSKEEFLAMLDDQEVQQKVQQVMSGQVTSLQSQISSLTCQLHNLQIAPANWAERIKEAINDATRATDHSADQSPS